MLDQFFSLSAAGTMCGARWWREIGPGAAVIALAFAAKVALT
jgi:hypothetical protein